MALERLHDLATLPVPQVEDPVVGPGDDERRVRERRADEVLRGVRVRLVSCQWTELRVRRQFLVSGSLKKRWVETARTMRTSQSRIELSRELVRRYTSVMSTEVTSPTCAVSVRMLSPDTVSQNRTCPSFDLWHRRLALPKELWDRKPHPLTMRFPKGLKRTEETLSEWPAGS